MIKVGVVGGTGYTGVELLRLLLRHEHVEICAITSRSDVGVRVDAMFPNLRGATNLVFQPPELDVIGQCDVAFFATPNGTAMTMVSALLKRGVRIIDLAADFRLKDAATWEHWYGMPHSCPDLLAEAVYGLPEVNRSAIRAARLVANPGCYPTAAQLALLPLVEQNLIRLDNIVIDAKSGVSGAGRRAEVGSLYCEATDTLRAYGVMGHRHRPEICQGLSACAGGKPVDITFVPHLTPMVRGIHATVYVQPTAVIEDVQSIYKQRFTDEPFVDVMAADAHPETRTVRGANFCRLAVHHVSPRRIVILSVIDNLVKGASGQALQNMNIMFGVPETSGLSGLGIVP